MIEFENDVANEDKENLPPETKVVESSASKGNNKKVKAEEVKPDKAVKAVEVPVAKPVEVPVAKPVPVKAAKVSKYEQWQKDHGSELIRKGLGQRNILLKAAKVSGAGFDEVMLILGQNIPLREKLIKIFKE